MQSEIILNCAFGSEVSKKKVIHEKEDGTEEMWSIIDAFIDCNGKMVERGFWPFQQAFPELALHAITPYDRRCTRNIKHVRAVFEDMLKEHRKEHESGKPITRDFDFLDMMIKDHYFGDKDFEIVSEALLFFSAGMNTIKNATTNMLIYLIRHPELKTKLIAEVDKITN